MNFTQICQILVIIVLCEISMTAAFARDWSARDSVELNSFTEWPIYTKQGDKFLVVTSRGDLQADQTESTVWLFSTQLVKKLCESKTTKQLPVGDAILKMRGDTYEENGSAPFTIGKLKWDKNGTRFYFLGRNNSWNRQLCVFDLTSKQTKILSADGEDVSNYSLARDSIFYLSNSSPEPSTLFHAGSGKGIPEVVRGTGYSSTELMFPNYAKAQYGPISRTIRKIESTGRTFDIGHSFDSQSSDFEISPDENWLIVRAQAQSVPTSWGQYQPSSSDYPRLKLDGRSRLLAPEQWILVNTKSGLMRPLTGTPIGQSLGYYEDNALTWSEDSSKVAVANCFFQIDRDKVAKLKPCVLVVNIFTDTVEAVVEHGSDNTSDIPVWDLVWHDHGRVLELQGNGLSQKFEKTNHVWTATTRSSVPNSKTAGLRVFPFQALDISPILMGTICDGNPSDLVKEKKAKLLLDPNPSLQGVSKGSCSIYTWNDPENRECTGGLLKPANFVEGKRYPLLIQTHSFNPYQFFNLGSSSTGYAGRVAAARGILVLQVGEPRKNSKFRGTQLEAEKDGRGCYMAAIDKLNKDGLIEADKIGIIGWSRTGWYVLDCLIHEPKIFKAATLADANSSSYGEYLRNVDLTSTGANYLDNDYGCKPFGEGLITWISRASGFNLDKVVAPILVQLQNPSGLLDWSTYAALRMQNKPVDLLYFRAGSHSESKPSLVLSSIETNTDWFDYWLNDHVDTDPQKSTQYQRWAELRKLH